MEESLFDCIADLEGSETLLLEGHLSEILSNRLRAGNVVYCLPLEATVTHFFIRLVGSQRSFNDFDREVVNSTVVRNSEKVSRNLLDID